ncbi:CDGSH iron-sulfur domain-containing protein 3 [Tropilaelaps mercedesae]|uniref:CDGSH iron-sulfur domain-containing protein 3 n=1 Tax=Tropilaelaps mercedesae TaxID=418985 RepID=A0A1V9XPI9_9ACAR|nr:CDGSH iron-sulfur domain-containing protein 3 [Tropilaelaps mercedesae]
MSPVAFEVDQEKKYLLCRHVKTFIPTGLRRKLGIKL